MGNHDHHTYSPTATLTKAPDTHTVKVYTHAPTPDCTTTKPIVAKTTKSDVIVIKSTTTAPVVKTTTDTAPATCGNEIPCDQTTQPTLKANLVVQHSWPNTPGSSLANTGASVAGLLLVAAVVLILGIWANKLGHRIPKVARAH